MPFQPQQPIVALHGFTGCGADFNPIIEKTKRSSVWVTPDLPGHGALGDDYSWEGVESTVGQLVEGQSVAPILLGYSMGARLALHYACKHPSSLRALVLIGLNPGIEDASVRESRLLEDRGLCSFMLSSSMGDFLTKWGERPLIRSQSRIPEPVRLEMARNRLKHRPEGLASALLGLGLGSMEPLWSDLAKLDLPVFLITGEEDKKYIKIAQTLMNSGLRGVSHHVIPGVGHCAHLENIPYFCTLLENIIEKTLKNARLSSGLI